MKTLTAIILVLCCFSLSMNAQVIDAKSQAMQECVQATKLADEGNYDASIQMLNDAITLDSSQNRFYKELAYDYYLKTTEKPGFNWWKNFIMQSKNENENTTELAALVLGHQYEEHSANGKAQEVFHSALMQFPNSGPLHASLSETLFNERNYFPALKEAEAGIQNAPNVADNYYWASEIYCHSTEKVWGMLYGELFLNLNLGHDSLRKARISQLLYTTFQNSIQIDPGNELKVDFSSIASSNGESSYSNLPYQVGVFERLISNSIKDESVVDLYSLNLIRTNFLKTYYEKQFNVKFPNVLFEYEAKIAEAGYLEAYNYWILQYGEPKQFATWLTNNHEQFQGFQKWVADNPLILTSSNYFISSQYSWKEKPESIHINRRIQINM